MKIDMYYVLSKKIYEFLYDTISLPVNISVYVATVHVGIVGQLLLRGVSDFFSTFLITCCVANVLYLRMTFLDCMVPFRSECHISSGTCVYLYLILFEGYIVEVKGLQFNHIDRL